MISADLRKAVVALVDGVESNASGERQRQRAAHVRLLLDFEPSPVHPHREVATERERSRLAALEEVARGVAEVIGPVFDSEGVSFALLGFTTGEDGWSTYVSNAERPSMIAAMREMVHSLENSEPIPPQREPRQ